MRGQYSNFYIIALLYLKNYKNTNDTRLFVNHLYSKESIGSEITF